MGEKTKKTVAIDDLDGIVDQILAAVNGEPRVAILGLVRGQHDLVAEKNSQISYGYVRGRLH